MILTGALAACTAAVLVVLSFAPSSTRTIPSRDVAAWVRAWLGRERAGETATAILQATHAGLRSQMPLVAALRAALQPHDAALRAPFEHVVRAIELNASVDEAVAGSRFGVRDRRVLVALDALALAAGEDLPASRAAELVASVAERLVFEHQVRSEVEARASGVHTQITILALIVPCFALYLVVTLPGLAATLLSPLGSHVLVPLALVLEVAGIVMSRSIVAGLEL